MNSTKEDEMPNIGVRSYGSVHFRSQRNALLRCWIQMLRRQETCNRRSTFYECNTK